MHAYLKLLALLAALAVIMAIPDVAIIILFCTAGLALPITFSATLLVYALCAGPLVAAWDEGWRGRLLGVGLSLLAVGVTCLLPGVLARFQTDRAARAYTANDLVPKAPVEGASLEVRRTRGGERGYYVDSEPCGGECRAVLSAGRVRWVRIVMDEGRRKAPAVSRYRLAEKTECTPGAGRLLDAACVMLVDDTSEPADIEISFAARQQFGARAGAFDLAEIRQAVVIVTHVRRASGLTEVYRQTEVDAYVATIPTILGPFGHNEHTKGVSLMRSERRINRISLSGVLASLGLLGAGETRMPVAATVRRDWRESVDDHMTSQVESTLALSQPASFNTEQAAVIRDWIMHARQITAWSPEQLSLLRRIVRDRRLKDPTNFDQIFERKPEVTRALLPDVIEMLEAHGISADYTPERQAAYRFAEVDAGLMRPYAPRIVALLGKSDDVRSILLPVIGRLGVDPLPHVLPFEADLDKKPPRRYTSGFPRVRGACFADAQWAPALVPELRKTVSAVRDGNNAPRAFETKVLKALVNLGDRQFVAEQLAGRNGVERLNREIARELSLPNSAAWLCNS